MSVKVPEIYWHGNKERIMSLDFCVDTKTLITGGSDSEFNSGFMKEWEVNLDGLFTNSDEVVEIENEKRLVNITFVNNLENGHTHTVNCVRFNQSGKLLASCGDDQKIIIWEKKMKPIFGKDEYTLQWTPKQLLMGHALNVMDLKWFANDKYLISASVDNASILWSLDKNKSNQLQRFEHTGYVQGVTVCPFMKYVVAQCNDRTVKIWKNTKNKNKLQFHILYTLKKPEKDSTNNENQENSNQSWGYFVDDNILQSFFRKPDFSPDGQILILAAAQYQKKNTDHQNNDGNNSKSVNYCPCALVFLRNNLREPCLALNTDGEHAVIVKFCPRIFRKNQKMNDTQQPLFVLDYQMIWAVATIKSVIIYTTQRQQPIAIVKNIHLQILTDLSWSILPNKIGNYNVSMEVISISSSDGYCSFVAIGKEDIGEEMPFDELPIELQEKFKVVSQCDKSKKPIEVEQLQAENIQQQQQQNIQQQNNNDQTGEQQTNRTNTVIISSQGKKRIVPNVIKIDE